MKEETFLGTIYGVEIHATTKDESKIQAINKYLEEARQALMEKDLSTGRNWSLNKVCKRVFGKSIFN